jgi:uncharacterized protein (DUF1800 family)
MERSEVRHLLNRFAFGPRQRDLETAEATSAAAWLNWQLDPAAINDAATDAQLEPYRAILLPPAQMQEVYMKTVRRRTPQSSFRELRVLNSPLLLQHAQMAQFVRQLASERQVLEIMVEFWFNHFNVYALKESVMIFVTDYIEHAIRPYALARFEDLLIATAHHPAMLVYLDNHLSSAAQAGGMKKTPSGITENYARELLELHTLGVRGGYTQQDVVEVARILTGWTVQDIRNRAYGFAFRPEMHDFGGKVVLGVTYAPKGGEQEGVELLKRLAAHPATARHLATKLCARFVDTPPPAGCIELLAKTYTSTRGDIRALLKALVVSPEFWQHRHTKLKSPNLYLVSAFRALGTAPGPGLHTRLANAMGEPKLMQPAPTGYPEDAEAWSSTAGMLDRMNFALVVAGDAVPKSPQKIDDAQLVEGINQALFAGFASPSTLDVLRTQVTEAADLRQKLRTAIALGLSSPDFQYY